MGKSERDRSSHKKSEDNNNNGADECSQEIDDSEEESRGDRKKRKKLKKEKKRDRKKSSKKSSRKRRSSRNYSSSDSSSDSEDDSSRESSYDERRRRRKHKKKKKRKEEPRKSKHHRSSKDYDEDEPDHHSNKNSAAQYELADALVNLFSKHSGMSDELPILLIRLCSGTTFSLDQSSVREQLGQVLRCLKPYGVECDETGSWGWKSPTGGMGMKSNAELGLVRVVRALLTEIGLSASVVMDYERTGGKPPPAPLTREGDNNDKARDQSPQPDDQSKVSHDFSKDIPILVQRMLHTFSGLETELSTLCETILQGESVSLESLPNEDLKQNLVLLLNMCHLEQCEMEDEEDDNQEENAKEGEPTFGFGLPENHAESAKASIQSVIQACRQVKDSTSRKILGPMRPPPGYTAATSAATLGEASDDEDDDEGPQLTSLDPEKMQALNARRREVVAAQQAAAAAALEEGGREEWMMVPGRCDFLDAIKAGKTIRNRQFQNIKAKEGDEEEILVDPAIQKEMNELLTAHKEARGRSLLEEHQAVKKQENEQQDGSAKKWNWNRNKDLDEGRRVDKDALKLVLGGAADGLKTKFQGGFQSAR